MTKHETAKQFESPTTAACPVAALGLRYGAAEKEWHALDSQGIGDHQDAAALNEMQMDTLVDFASMSQPTSPLGALFQVLIVSAQADCIYSHAEGDAHATARRDVIRLEGALWGVRRFLEMHFGISAADIGGEHMMTESVSYAAKLRNAVAAASEAPASEFRQAAE